MGKQVKTEGLGYGKGHGGNTPNLPVIRPTPLTPAQQFLIATGRIQKDTKAYKAGKLFILLSHNERGYHASISHPERYPTWDEIAYIRYELIPNECYMAMMLPPREEYVNLHNFVFQLVEIPKEVSDNGPHKSV